MNVREGRRVATGARALSVVVAALQIQEIWRERASVLFKHHHIQQSKES